MKRFRYVALALLMTFVMVFTSCSPAIQTGSGSRTWSTFKRNSSNYDYPKEPNFAKMSNKELSQFRADMNKDPEGMGAEVEIRDGNFNINVGNMLMQQDSEGEWYAAVSMNGEVVVMHFTNEWPDRAWPSLLPGKPNLKFVGESVIEINSTQHQWMGMFVNMSGANINSVLSDYIGRLNRSGWTYGSDEYGEYFAKEINGRYTEVTFANVGPFYYVYVWVDGV